MSEWNLVTKEHATQATPEKLLEAMKKSNYKNGAWDFNGSIVEFRIREQGDIYCIHTGKDDGEWHEQHVSYYINKADMTQCVIY